MAKQVGRLSLRILPDATKFRNDLRVLIKRIETTYYVNLKVQADTRDAELELAKFRALESTKSIDVNAKVNTLAAKAQMLALARSRFVDLKVRVTSASIAKVKASLAALSGARLTHSVLGEISEALRNIDQNVPKIARVSLAFANLTSAVLAAGVGIITTSGDILDILNVSYALPAVFGALATGVTVLALALKDSGKYLGKLKPQLATLQTAIDKGFWTEAQGPIINFVQAVLPALRNGVGATATALGKQAGAVAGALKTSLGGGVLEGLFGKLTESIDIVTGGIGNFVAAFVTMGQVGSTFLPRLSQWFVDIGAKFNAFIQQAAADGSLAGFIESGIRNLKLLGDSLVGIARIFRAIDRAATAAGAGGLQTFSKAVNGAAAIMSTPAFQTALTTILEGVNAGMSKVGGSIKAFGGALEVLAPTIKSVLTIAGSAVSSLVTAIANAMKQPAFAKGLKGLFSGIADGIQGVLPVIPQIVAILGQLGGVVGVAAKNFLPLIAAVKDALAPAVSGLITVAQNLIPILSGGLKNAVDFLAPGLQALGNFLQTNSGLVTGLALALGGLVAIIKLVSFAKMTAELVAGAVAWAVHTKAVIADKLETLAIMALYAKDFVVALAKAGAALLVQAGQWAVNTAALIANKLETVALVALYAKDFVVSLAKTGAALVVQAGQWAASTAAAVANKAATIAAGVTAAARAVAGIAKTGAALVVQTAAWIASNAAQLAAKVAILAGAAAEGIATAAQWALNVAMDANPLGIIILAIAALVAALVWFFTQTDVGKKLWAGFVSFLTDAWNNIVSFVTDAVNNVSKVITAVVSFIVNAWNTYWSTLFLIVSTVWNAIVAAVQAAAQWVSDVITSVVSFIVTAWNLYWSTLLAVVSAIWNAIVAAVQAAVQWVSDIITSVVSFIVTAWNLYWSTLLAVVSAVWNGIVSFVSGAIAWVQSIIQAGMAVVQSIWAAIWNAIVTTVSNVVSGVKSFVGGLVDSVKSTIDRVVSTVLGIKDKIVGFFAGAGKWLLDAGKSIIQGLIDGINGMIKGAQKAIGGVMDAIAKFLPHSPAKEGPFSGKGWTLYSGQAIGEGLADGIDGTTSKVRASALRMMSAAALNGSSVNIADASTTALATGAAGTGDVVNVNGNIGYDPQAVANAIAEKKRQAQILAGVRKVSVAT